MSYSLTEDGGTDWGLVRGYIQFADGVLAAPETVSHLTKVLVRWLTVFTMTMRRFP